MRRSDLLQGIREMKFVSVQKRYGGGEIAQAAAAELLGISERTFRRWCYREEGMAGLADGRLGRAAPNRVPETEAEQVEVLYRQHSAGFPAKHFDEHLVRGGFRWGYTWTKALLQRRSLLPAASSRRRANP